jgi:hypothetical protein
VPLSRAQNQRIAFNFSFQHMRVTTFLVATRDKFLRLLPTSDSFSRKVAQLWDCKENGEATFPRARSYPHHVAGQRNHVWRYASKSAKSSQRRSNNQIRAVRSNRYICSYLASTHSLVDGSAHSCFYLSLQRLHSANKRLLTKFAIALCVN